MSDRLVEFGDLGIDLPPLPYNLHPKAGQRKFPAVTEEDEERTENSLESVVVSAKSHPVEVQPFGSYKEDVEAVVIEASETKLGRDGEDDEVAVGALAGPPRQYVAGPRIVNYNTNNHLLYNPLVRLDPISKETLYTAGIFVINMISRSINILDWSSTLTSSSVQDTRGGSSTSPGPRNEKEYIRVQGMQCKTLSPQDMKILYTTSWNFNNINIYFRLKRGNIFRQKACSTMKRLIDMSRKVVTPIEAEQ